MLIFVVVIAVGESLSLSTPVSCSGATIYRHDSVGEYHRSDTIMLVLVLFPFLLWPFWWKPRL